MTRAGKLICLIAPGHLASTPRLLKEADSLCAAGYRVHVVCLQNFRPNVPADDEIVRTATWACTRINSLEGGGVFVRKLLRRLARIVARVPGGLTPGIAARVVHADTLLLADRAASLQADYYIGHCLPGLAAAALAAERAGTGYGFDIEDFHDAEVPATQTTSELRAATGFLQSRWLPKACHLSAASPLIAEQYIRDYGASAATILNVFPISAAPAGPADPGPVSTERPARLYWFSQTVGPDRGIEDVVAAMGRMRVRAELHLRGHVSDFFRQQLDAHAQACGIGGRIVYLPFSTSAEMTRLAAGMDLGLSTEQREPLNRDLCLANKVFVYLLAGLPQLMTNTSAHSALAPELGEAALLADLTDPVETARLLDGYLSDPARVAAARATAWRLGRDRYNWDREQTAFLNLVHNAVGAP